MSPLQHLRALYHILCSGRIAAMCEPSPPPKSSTLSSGDTGRRRRNSSPRLARAFREDLRTACFSKLRTRCSFDSSDQVPARSQGTLPLTNGFTRLEVAAVAGDVGAGGRDAPCAGGARSGVAAAEGTARRDLATPLRRARARCLPLFDP